MLTSKHNINATIFMAAFCPDNLWGDRSAAVQPFGQRGNPTVLPPTAGSSLPCNLIAVRRHHCHMQRLRAYLHGCVRVR